MFKKKVYVKIGEGNAERGETKSWGLPVANADATFYYLGETKFYIHPAIDRWARESTLAGKIPI